jgi:hypothetical protein
VYFCQIQILVVDDCSDKYPVIILKINVTGKIFINWLGTCGYFHWQQFHKGNSHFVEVTMTRIMYQNIK